MSPSQIRILISQIFLILFSSFSLSACDDGLHHAPGLSCDPLKDEGCPSGTHCRLLPDGQACLAPSAPPSGLNCDSASCSPSEVCSKVEGRLACYPLCLEDEECGPGRCAYEVGAWGLCVQPCDLILGCDSGAACAPVLGLSFPICIAAGEEEQGALCGGCQAGLACLSQEGEARCLPLCLPEAPRLCPLGSRCEGPIEGVEGLLFCL